MPSHLDIYRSGWLVLQERRDDAAPQANLRARALLEAGNAEDEAVRRWIATAVGPQCCEERPNEGVSH